jgi:sarcosine oxidase
MPMKIAVIGVGAAGGSAARFLAQGGHDVTGFEQFLIGHDRGSSHGESRIVRYTYPDSFYSELMAESFPLWDELERDAGESFLVRCGCLFVGPAEHPEMAAIARALIDAGRAYEALSPEAAQTRFPAIRLGPGEAAVFQPEGGFIRAGGTVTATARLARAAGAVLREETPVAGIEEREGRVIVSTTDGSEEAFDAAIVTAGAWAGQLFVGAGLPLRVSREQFVYLAIARHPEHFDPERFPVWIDAATYDYGFPSDGRVAGVKLSLHRSGGICDPDTVSHEPDEEFARARAAYAAGRLPDLDPTPVHARVCLYTSTPDEDFIVDRAPGFSNVWLASACSGHGFKFAILIGKIAASLAVTGAPATAEEDAAARGIYTRAMQRFSLERFHV